MSTTDDNTFYPWDSDVTKDSVDLMKEKAESYISRDEYVSAGIQYMANNPLWIIDPNVLPDSGSSSYIIDPNVPSGGGSSSYYELPEGAKELQDLIEHRDMNFAQGNIFKAVYRLGKKGNDLEYDLNKIIWFAQRELDRIKKV